MSIDRSGGRRLCAFWAGQAEGATLRRSWRFSLFSAGLLGLAAILHLAPAEATSARSTSGARPEGVSGPGKGAKLKGGTVTLAEVTISGAESSRLVNLPDLVRHDVEAELAAIDWSKLGLRRHYKLSASVVRLSSARNGDQNLMASCTISAAVRDAERGTLLVIIEGRARAEDAPGAAAEAERGALAGAVRGAITAVPEAIQRSL
jgi:hypothetical protein